MADAAITPCCPDGALRKRREHQVVPFVYAGAAIMSPSLFADAPAGEFSLTKMFDRANEQETAVRPAARRRVDACRNPRRRCEAGGRGVSGKRGVGRHAPAEGGRIPVHGGPSNSRSQPSLGMLDHPPARVITVSSGVQRRLPMTFPVTSLYCP